MSLSEYSDNGLNPLPQDADAKTLYLDLMKRILTNIIYQDVPTFIYDHLHQPQIPTGFSLTRRVKGEDAPLEAHTMVGMRRLDNIQTLVEEVLEQNIPGDLVEAGVYRGGACIFMRALLRAFEISDRRVFACDTFNPLSPTQLHWSLRLFLKGLASIPGRKVQKRIFMWLDRRPNEKRAFPVVQEPSDDWVDFSMWLLRHPEAMPSESGTGLEHVKSHFARYGLLDGQVVFLQGFFADTMKGPPIKQIALMRLDGDSYESTMDALTHLYYRLSHGGYCIIDDYNAFHDCKRATTDFRKAHNIDDPIVSIDNLAVYWKKSGKA